MARRHSRRASSGGFGGGKSLVNTGGFIGSALKGMGAAALTKRFVGAPLGTFTGAAAGYLLGGGIAGAVGGYVHDNIGNVGGGSGVSGGQRVYG